MLDEVEVWPVRTNAGFLFNALLDEDFGTARIDTGFIERKLDELVPDPEPDEAIWRGAAAVATAEEEGDTLGELAGFRLNAPTNARRRARPRRRVPPHRARRRSADGGSIRLSRRGAGGRLLRRPGL